MIVITKVNFFSHLLLLLSSSNGYIIPIIIIITISFPDGKLRSKFGDSSGEDDSDEDDESNKSADNSHDQVSLESVRVLNKKLSLVTYI